MGIFRRPAGSRRAAALLFALASFCVPAALTLAIPAEQQTAIRKVIEEQEDAFKRDDAAGAFQLASPGIQASFGTPQRFLEMVRAQYEPVYRPRVMKFLDAVEVEGRVVQRVFYIGSDGLQVLALYPMMQMPDGAWRTDGCYLMPIAAGSA